VNELGPKVSVLPLPRQRATERVREAVEAGRWSIPSHEGLAPGYKWLVQHRQIELCLREGYILDDYAKLDEHGYWVFRIARVCAGVDVVIHVAMENVAVAPHVIVVKITGDVIEL
jgi:hypothetical protein